MRQIDPAVFLHAAEKQFCYTFEGRSVWDLTNGNTGFYSCDNLQYATQEDYLDSDFPEFVLYREYFQPTDQEKHRYKPPGFGWWPYVNGHWDNESRILALLLAGEIAKDLVELNEHTKRDKRTT